jgi:hypothetical protein
VFVKSGTVFFKFIFFSFFSLPCLHSAKIAEGYPTSPGHRGASHRGAAVILTIFPHLLLTEIIKNLRKI